MLLQSADLSGGTGRGRAKGALLPTQGIFLQIFIVKQLGDVAKFRENRFRPQSTKAIPLDRGCSVVKQRVRNETITAKTGKTLSQQRPAAQLTTGNHRDDASLNT